MELIVLTKEQLSQTVQEAVSQALLTAGLLKQETDLITFPEMAKELRCTTETVSKKIKERHIQVIKMGRTKGIKRIYFEELKLAS
jgi:excisionase family DNA binding protein